jgi:cytochrome b subunit of formate dehydrogenase
MRRWWSDRRNIRRIGRWLGWLTVVLLLVTILTGYGITEARTVTAFTLGLLTKPLAQRVHQFTEVWIAIFLAAHILIALWMRRFEPRGKE